MAESDPVVVLAFWHTTPDLLSAVLAAITELRSRTLVERGCTGYEALQQIGDPTWIVLIEEYRDAAAQQDHVNSDHYREIVVERIRPMLIERRVEMLRLSSVH